MGRAIVPEADAVRGPFESHLIFRHVDLTVEEVEKILALFAIHALDMRREDPIYVEAAAFRFGMGPHDRV